MKIDHLSVRTLVGLTGLLFALACQIPSFVSNATPSTAPARITTSPATAPATSSAATPSSAAAPTRADNVVQGSVYGIKLIGTERTGDPVMVGIKNGVPEYIKPSPGHVILKAKVEFYKNGTLIQGMPAKEPAEMAVLDSKGQVYKPFDSYNMVLEQDGTFRTAVVYFDVPQDALGLKLRYRDVGLIDLTP